MLNINQNFDLKAPVFNFDRDYFNSVEELNAYDTSNVPNHFVTNVAGMLYLFTEGKWWPILGTTYNGSTILVGGKNTSLNIGDLDRSTNFGSGYIDIYGSDQSQNGRLFIDTDTGEPNIELYDDRYGIFKFNTSGFRISSNSTSDSKEISLSVNDTEAVENYSSTVNVSLSDTDSGGTININASDGFRHSDGVGGVGTFYSNGLYLSDGINRLYMHANLMTINNDIGDFVSIGTRDGKHSLISLGTDHKFKISYPEDGTEGATITGVESITAFANPSATKVWATDGSTVDLTTKADASALATKANKSDVLLKKNSRGGYYIGDSNDSVGSDAFSIGNNTADGSNSFAEGYDTKAYGSYSHVEGLYTEARGESAHAEGDFTYAKGVGSHSEGRYTHAAGSSSHAEGHNTYADGFAAHALGNYNVSNKNAIHSVGIGNSTTRKNAEYIYAKNNTDNTLLVDDPKNGYKYLIGVGGYDGISTDNTTYKSVQEVIADLTARIEQLETKVRALEAANTPA